ncbi:esterase [Ilyomonas limi]|uniref:Esterase n=1 Tax=Ilyomonas limi TaxID=2575867 RepID=A0A4U3L154_9BACT|nr:alpha/beta fold hydrolase [Ilyomonas limi]TKK67939.1 esterase [Ilyomonas limi]
MIYSTIKDETSVQNNEPSLQYLIREPKTNTTTKKAIVLLHGVGSNEHDLFSLADQLPDEYFIISPQGQFALGAGRYAWYQVDFSTGKPVINAEQEVSSRKVLIAFISQLKKQYNLDEVYLGGFSQGAIMSYSIGLTHPQKVEGIILLSGRLLNEITPLINKEEDLQQLKVFMAHGIQDNILPITYAREAKTYLQTLNVQLSYHEYNTGHQINSAIIKDLNDWLK